ncbi:hypothetical protein ACFZCP_27350 [Streptomyces sp. NPDC007971]|uniref:hypothetical protein n=1 Tax=Streptomyces sp. NPDC007971 TaxID=3364799 RepID=UPI0036E8CCB9
MSVQESDIQRTYRLWFEHTRMCEQCKRVTKAVGGCETGRELWGAYRLARIGAPIGLHGGA